jgi:hypothetical protein
MHLPDDFVLASHNRLWRPSEQFTQEHPNALWRQASDHLAAITAHREPATIEPEELDLNYSHARLDVPYTDQAESILSRLPDEWHPHIPSTAGAFELDLLEWCSNISAAKHIINIVGSRGVGKTASTHYLLRSLVPALPAFRSRYHPNARQLLPIIVDCRSFPPDQASLQRELHSLLIHMTGTAASTLAPAASNAVLQLVHSRIQSHPNAPDTCSTVNAIVSALASHLSGTHITPLIAFDNLDAIAPFSRQFVLALSRALALHCRAKIMLPARPWTRHEALCSSHMLGQFATNTVTIPPPDFSHILQRRIDARTRLLGSRAISADVLGSNIAVSIHNIRYMFAHLIDQVFSTSTCYSILVDLCNFDVRNALFAARAILRSSQLPTDVYMRSYLSQPGAAGSRPGTPAPARQGRGRSKGQGSDRRKMLPYDHVVSTMMVDWWPCYSSSRDADRNIVLNLFDAGVPGTSHNYTIIHFLLSYLSWRDDVVSVSELSAMCHALRLPARLVKSAISHMFAFGLLDSPETDEDFGSVVSVAASESGLYYYAKLSRNPHYIYECIPDIALSHESVPRKMIRPPTWAQRTDSWLELIRRVSQSEWDMLQYMVADQQFSAMFDLPSTSLLSHSLIVAAREHLGDLRQSHDRVHDQNTRIAHTRMESELSDGSDIMRLQRLLHKKMNRTTSRWQQNTPSPQHFRTILSDGSEMVIDVPAVLEPQRPAFGRVAIDRQSSFLNDNIVVHLSFTNAVVATSAAAGGREQKDYAMLLIFSPNEKYAKKHFPLKAPGRTAVSPKYVAQAMYDGRLLGRIG